MRGVCPPRAARNPNLLFRMHLLFDRPPNHRLAPPLVGHTEKNHLEILNKYLIVLFKFLIKNILFYFIVIN
jgi:hypothetical protein